MAEKKPVIIMTVTLAGVSVETGPTETLKPEQRAGFDALAAKVHHFAASLVEQAFADQNRRSETVN